MEHLLEMRNLSIDLSRGKKRPPVKLVEGIDLNIDKKQTFGVVGESGCGKSITCSSIMGLLSFPLSVGKGSSIRFQRSDGHETELLKLSKREMQKLRGKDISMIDPQLHPGGGPHPGLRRGGEPSVRQGQGGGHGRPGRGL